MTANACRHFLISGLVQGVYYRASCRQAALALGVTGWVRNLPNGQVEALGCGTEQQLAEFERWLHKGPITADVKNVTSEIRPISSWADFSVR
jgi:acylphosphatase